MSYYRYNDHAFLGVNKISLDGQYSYDVLILRFRHIWPASWMILHSHKSSVWNGQPLISHVSCGNRNFRWLLFPISLFLFLSIYILSFTYFLLLLSVYMYFKIYFSIWDGSSLVTPLLLQSSIGHIYHSPSGHQFVCRTSFIQRYKTFSYNINDYMLDKGFATISTCCLSSVINVW